MFNIRKITNEEVADFFNNDPQLAYMGLSDDVLANLYHNKEYSPSEHSKLKGLYLGDDLVFVFKYEHFTPVCLNIHCYLSSKLHHSDALKDITEFLTLWLHDKHPWTVKIITMIPDSCEHATNAAKKFGFIQEGCLTKAIIWRQELTDLLIYSMRI